MGASVVAAVDRRCRMTAGAEHLALGHEAGIDQIVEHHVGARARGRQVDVGREFRRRLEQAGEHRGFGEIDVARRLVEIVMRRGVDAERAAAHIGAVEIKLEDLVLGQPRFQPHRQEGFLDLALDRPLIIQKQIFRQLLRRGRAALNHAAGARVGHEGAQRAADIDAEMVVEAPVFGREHGLDQMIGELVERHRVVMADAAAADLVAVAVEEGDGELGFLQPVVVGGFLERGDGERQQQDQPGGAERCAFGGELGEPAPPTGDVEMVHEGRIALVGLRARRSRSGTRSSSTQESIPSSSFFRFGFQSSGKRSRKAWCLALSGAGGKAPRRSRQFTRLAAFRPCRAGVNARQGERKLR